MTHSVYTNELFPSATPVITKWVYKWSSHGGKNGGFCMGSAMLIYTGHDHSGYNNHQEPIVETNTESQTWHHISVWSVSCLVASWLCWTASIVEGVAFCFYWNNHSRYGFAFLTYNDSAKITILGHIRCLIYYHGFPHSMSYDKESHLTAKEIQHWAHAHGIHSSYHIPHNSGAANLEWHSNHI